MWSGDQIDQVINGSQSFGSTLTGVAQPMPLFNNSEFWPNGLSAGFQIRF